jgi:hypothetical protein
MISSLSVSSFQFPVPSSQFPVQLSFKMICANCEPANRRTANQRRFPVTSSQSAFIQNDLRQLRTSEPANREPANREPADPGSRITKGHTSQSNKIHLNLLISTIARPQVERSACHLINERNSNAEASEINTLQVMTTCVARVDAQVLPLR